MTWRTKYSSTGVHVEACALAQKCDPGSCFRVPECIIAADAARASLCLEQLEQGRADAAVVKETSLARSEVAPGLLE